MDIQATRGHLQKNPLSFLLFELWQQKKNGRLTLKQGEEEKILNLEEGDIAVDSDTFDENKFFTSLAEQAVIDPSALQKCRSLAEKKQISWIKACTHLEIISPPHLWKLIQDSSQSSISSLFDWDEAEYSFHTDSFSRGIQALCHLPTLVVILQGTRQMTNHNLIRSQLPENETSLKALFPRHLPQLFLLPHEEYLLKMIPHQPNLKALYDLSELSLKETQKIIFTFLSLGLFVFSRANEKRQTKNNITQGELHNILDSFNKKWMCTFKYISKELGPVASNILEKNLEESKSRLSPLFQNIKLLQDGRIDTDSVLKAKFNFSSPDTKQNLLTGLNEILVSGVLTVKKILGDEHEAALVRNLAKIDT